MFSFSVSPWDLEGSSAYPYPTTAGTPPGFGRRGLDQCLLCPFLIVQKSLTCSPPGNPWPLPAACLWILERSCCFSNTSWEVQGWCRGCDRLPTWQLRAADIFGHLWLTLAAVVTLKRNPHKTLAVAGSSKSNGFRYCQAALGNPQGGKFCSFFLVFIRERIELIKGH